MSGKSQQFATQALKLFLQGVAIPNIADNAASSPITTLYAQLLTSDPGTSSSQLTNEIAYGSYARVAVSRSTGAWIIANGVATPVNAIVFPTSSSSGGPPATFWGIGTSLTGAGELLISGPLSRSLPIGLGTQPVLTQLTTITEG